MNNCSDTPSREVLQGEKAANRRYQWYEQIIAGGCRHLVGTAHEIARSGFQIGIDELARRIRASEATARRERDELIKRGHLIKFSGRGRRGKEACNRYGMVLKVADLQTQICRSDTRRRVSDLTPDSPLAQGSPFGPRGPDRAPSAGATGAPSRHNQNHPQNLSGTEIKNTTASPDPSGGKILASENRDQGADREETVKVYRVIIKCYRCKDTGSANVVPVAGWEVVEKGIQQMECEYCGSKLGAEIDGCIDYPKSRFDAERAERAARRAERDRRNRAQVKRGAELFNGQQGEATPLDFREDPDADYCQD